MKAKELISVLQACDPESEVPVTIGDYERYRENVAFIASGHADDTKNDCGSDILTDMAIRNVNIETEDNNLVCHLIVYQDVFTDEYFSAIRKRSTGYYEKNRAEAIKRHNSGNDSEGKIAKD